MRGIIRMLAATSAIALAAPSLAVPYRFDVFDPTIAQGGMPIDNDTYYFFFDSAPNPTIFTAYTFSLSGTVFYTVGGAVQTLSGPVNFQTSDVAGGLDTPLGRYSGDQLFTGTTSSPTFRLGPFQIDVGTVTISVAGSPAGGVPEPASWAMMIAGFGLVGAALRSRRSSVRFAL